MSDHKTETTRAGDIQCPHCGLKIKQLTGPGAPSPGAIVICGVCAGLGVLRDDLSLRAATKKERRDAMDSLETRFTIQIIKGRAHAR